MDLDDYFKSITKDSLSNRIIKPCIAGTCTLFWIALSDKNVIFKKPLYEYNNYSELISEELANHLGLKNAHYDLAIFRGYKGIISYDYRLANHKYVDLYNILKEYIFGNKLLITENKENTYEIFLKDYDILEKFYIVNNLEDIWDAFEYHLKKYGMFDNEIIPNLIEKLMVQLTDYFCYQIISGDFDLHSGNISVAIANDFSDIELAPFFDNEDMFLGSGEIDYTYPGMPRLLVKRSNVVNKIGPYDALKEYLSVSDSFFVKRFLDMIDKLDNQTIIEMIRRVEVKTESNVPEGIKLSLIENFNNNLENINSVSESLNLKLKRKHI